MGQLCCFPFSQAEEKISGRRRAEPDEAELLRISRRLVDDAVNRAVEQYKKETLQNGGGPNTAALPPTEGATTKTDASADAAAGDRK